MIDRLKVEAPDAAKPRAQTDGLKQRLAESFETALRHADGRAIAAEMDSGKEHLFSAKFACPICSYSIPELEPRLFSFNNPMGACPRCARWASRVRRSQARVAFPHLSLAGGAIPQLGPAQPVLLLDAAVARAQLAPRRRDALPVSSRARAADRPRLAPARRDRLPLSRRGGGRGGARSEASSPASAAPSLETDSVAVKEGALPVPQRALPGCHGTRLTRGAPRIHGGAQHPRLSGMPLKGAALAGTWAGGAKARPEGRARDREPSPVPERREAGHLSLTRSGAPLLGERGTFTASQIVKNSTSAWVMRIIGEPSSACTSATTRASSRP